MEFEKALKLALEYLSSCGPSYISTEDPRGIWFCDSAVEVQHIANNAVCLPIGGDWDDVIKCRPFFELFPYVAIVTPNAIAREQMVKALAPRLSACCVYVIQDSGFKGCKTIQEYIAAYGHDQLLNILSGAEELPAYGLLDLSEVAARDLTKVPRTLSGFPRLDKSMGGILRRGTLRLDGKAGQGQEYDPGTAPAERRRPGPSGLRLLRGTGRGPIPGVDLPPGGGAGPYRLPGRPHDREAFAHSGSPGGPAHFGVAP